MGIPNTRTLQICCLFLGPVVLAGCADLKVDTNVVSLWDERPVVNVHVWNAADGGLVLSWTASSNFVRVAVNPTQHTGNSHNATISVSSFSPPHNYNAQVTFTNANDPNDCETIRVSFGTQGKKRHLLIGESFLEIGNWWEYQKHTVEVNGQPVDEWETRDVEVVGTDTVEGLYAAVWESRSDGRWNRRYWYLTSEYVMEAGWEDDNGKEVVRDSDPWEALPVWIDETDENRHYGHGLHRGWDKRNSSNAWAGHKDGYVTFLHEETITVPAGTFECVVVFVHSESSDSGGCQRYYDTTLWFDRDVGIIRMDSFEWERHGDGSEESESYTLELASTNVLG